MIKKHRVDVCVIFPRYIVRNFGAPLGALYLCSALKEKGFNVSFIDGTVTSYDETIELLKKSKPNFVAISIQTVFADFAFSLAEDFKKINPKGTVIVGGPHASILPEETIMHKSIDFVVVGEGEETLPELLSSIKNPEKVNGIAFKRNAAAVFTQPRQPITDLDNICFPDRALLSDEYFKRGSTPIITSRGCPFNCAFCQPTLRKIFGNLFRTRSVDNVIAEIKEIKKIFKKRNASLKELHFTDDGLTYNHKWLEKLANEIIRQKLNITWSANTRADTIPNIKLLRLLKKAGLKKFSIGVESGDPFIRNEILKKGVSQEKLITAFDLCHESDIQSHAYLMVGSPEESNKSIDSTVTFLDRIKPNDTQVTITSPLPGTYLYHYSIEHDIINPMGWSDFAYCNESHLDLKNFTKKDIKKIQRAIHYTIYLHRIMEKKGINLKYSTIFKILRQPGAYLFLRCLEDARYKIKNTLK